MLNIPDLALLIKSVLNYVKIFEMLSYLNSYSKEAGIFTGFYRLPNTVKTVSLYFLAYNLQSIDRKRGD